MNAFSRGLGVLGNPGLCLSADPIAGQEVPFTKVNQTFTVSTVPDATKYPKRLIFVTNGATGDPCLAISDGTNWLRILIGAAVAAS